MRKVNETTDANHEIFWKRQYSVGPL